MAVKKGKKVLKKKKGKVGRPKVKKKGKKR